MQIDPDAGSPAPGRPALCAWSADRFAALAAAAKPPPSQPVLAPVLARGAITLVTGPRGVGKSWLALAMAHAAARGGAVLGWSAPAACRVAYLDVCGGQGLLAERLAAIAGKRPPPRLVLVPGDAQAHGLPDLDVESGIAALDDIAVDADLVVLDGVSALVRGGRGLAARWQALAVWLRGLRRRGLAVLLVDAVEPRALLALADTVLRLDRPLDWTEEEGARFTLRIAAARGLTGKTCRRFEARLAVRRGRAAWTKIAAGDDRAILAWRMSEEGYTSREIAQKLEVSPASAWRLIERGAALDPALRDNAEIRAAVREERRREAAALREADRKAREWQKGVAAWAQIIGPIRGRSHPHPSPSSAGGRRDAAPHSSAPASASRSDEGVAGASQSSPACRATSIDAGQGEGSAAAALKQEGQRQTANPPEAMKQPPPQPPAPPPLTRAQLLWRTPMRELLAGRPEG